MKKATEEQLISILNIQKSKDWDVFLGWLNECDSKVLSKLRHETGENVFRYQGQAILMEFILGQMSGAREAYSLIKNS